jgi:hypothetical protein
MRMKLVSLALLALLLLGVPPRARAANHDLPGCDFLPLFTTLRSLIGAQMVGACVQDEPAGPDGAVAQRTSTGLLVWRPADERPAFTDGARTWLLGPGGLVWQRGNEERFDWEPVPPDASPVTLLSGLGPATAPPCLPAVEGWERTAGGVVAQVDNPCGAEEVFGLSMVLYDWEAGRPMATTREMTWQAAAGERRAAFLAGRTVGTTWGAFLATAAPPRETLPTLCLDVGAGHCLVTDSWLYGTVRALQGLDPGRALLRAAATGYVQLRWADAPFDALAFYNFDTRAVTVDRAHLGTASDWERAALLAHELQHAADYAAGRSFAPGAECLDREVDATLVQGQVWQQLWQGRLPVATTAVQDDLNGVAMAATLDRPRLTRRLAPVYQPQCGPVAVAG